MTSTILNTMASLKLHGMRTTYRPLLEKLAHHEMTHDELIGTLIQSEWEHRENSKVHRYLQQAKFRYGASLEEIDLDANRGIDKNKLLRLTDGTFIRKKENLLITGPTGVGKSYIASAIGHQCCQMGFKTLYFNTQKLIARLRLLKADGSYAREIAKIERYDLLILDDFGLQLFDNESRMALMEIIEDRHGRKSTIIASQLPIAKWYEVIGESTIADAILDRMIHTAHRIELKGESRRKK